MSLKEMRPLPDPSQRVTKKARKVYSKHPSPHLTSTSSMEYTREKDKDYTPGDMGPKLVVTPKRGRGREKKPIPFSLPKPSLVVPKPHEKYRCSTCTYPSCADYHDKWVECSACSSLSHLTCLVTIGQLCNSCGCPIFVKKTPKVPTKTELLM
jgi:DNA-directed RNA polymerase subunit RPC12/RpoP